MSDIIEIPLEDFKKNRESLKNSKVKIKEFKFFINSAMAYDDYYLLIGPRGGVTVHYGKGKTLNTGYLPFKNSGPNTGVMHQGGGAYRKTLIFPSARGLPKALAKLEKSLTETVRQYKKTYDNANTRLKRLQKLSEEYPEYSL